MKHRKNRIGFTLIELLVVIAIIALLLSVLLPGLKKAKDYSKRVICGARLKQIGSAMKLYANAFDEYLPDDHDLGNPANRERHAYVVYRQNPGYVYLNGKLKPLRFAYLYELDYIDVPEIFYCPGNRLQTYMYESYTNPSPWGSLPQAYNANTGNEWVRIGYIYYPVEVDTKLDPAWNAPRELALKYIKLHPSMPYTADIIHNRPTISHQNNKIYSLNGLYADGHVSFCNDQSVFQNLKDPSGKDIWNTLDAGGFDIRFYDTAYYTVFRAMGP
ncbi:MAG TPA: type II secretion system protein [Anaerohalosphaeraceae bacterium]|nr:type II secretion system protein [Phycisphaerae bacterium]HOK96888.1 type II secretion system protein [Anaerohalosphaeraceae bacterium]HOL31611.1 type II secretion system protein [Anaerohalosphaeraceae bacterium]HPO70636.1 type II secretion system protein [Anaerohalosphaeraceae bacterium]HRV21361.1 type II secretion system protein [Anaerohalosphaeraceae bacterium]